MKTENDYQTVSVAERNTTVSSVDQEGSGRLPVGEIFTIVGTPKWIPTAEKAKGYQGILFKEKSGNCRPLSANTVKGIGYRDGKRMEVINRPFLNDVPLDEFIASGTVKVKVIAYQPVLVDEFGKTTKVNKDYPVFEVVNGNDSIEDAEVIETTANVAKTSRKKVS